MRSTLSDIHFHQLDGNLAILSGHLHEFIMFLG